MQRMVGGREKHSEVPTDLVEYPANLGAASNRVNCCIFWRHSIALLNVLTPF